MTPEERAKVILAIVRNPDTLNDSHVEMAAAQIREVVDEARKEFCESAVPTTKREEEIRAEERERIAEMIDNNTWVSVEEVAKAIRELK